MIYKDNLDGQVPSAMSNEVIALLLGFNGTSFDRMRTNLSNITLATLAAQGLASNQPSTDQVNYNGRGVNVVIDITALAGTAPTLTVTIQAKDPVSGKYYTVLASAALAAVATTVLRVYPGLVAAANLIANDALPRDWRIIWTVGGTTPAVTATIAASIIN